MIMPLLQNSIMNEYPHVGALRSETRIIKIINNSMFLLAGVNIDIFHTSLTFDETTPVKFAVASFSNSRFLRVVSSAATKKIAAIHAG